MTSANELFLHDFRLRAIEQLATERFLHFGITARDCVADDHAVRRRREILASKSLCDVDAELLQHRRHRWIDILIRSSDVMPASLKHPGEGSHRGAADAD